MNGTIRFGEWEIDTVALELRRDGTPVPLTPQAVRALIVLVASAGRLVSRDELYHELWPEPDVDVDRGLNTVIRQIRMALGDDATDPTYIRTYPRRGYRFLIDQPASASGAAWATRLWSRQRVAVAVAGIAVLTIVLVLARFGPGREGSAGPEGAGDDIDSAIAAAGLDADVRERFLEGVFLLEQGSPARRAQAVAPLEAVTAAAPDFALGHAWLADALFWAGRYENARASAAAALALDGTQARALIIRGTVRLVRDWDRVGAESDLRAAVRLAADEPEPHHALAFALATAGRHSDAIRELETAHRLDPVSAIVTGDLGLIHLYAGDLDGAAEFCARAVTLEPDAAWAIECAFDALAHLGRNSEARPLAGRLVSLVGELPDSVLGGSDESDTGAVRRFRDWRADRAVSALGRGGSHMAAALALAGAGRREEAAAALEKAARERGPALVTITIDPRLRPLRSEPQFRALAADLARHGFARLPS